MWLFAVPLLLLAAALPSGNSPFFPPDASCGCLDLIRVPPHSLPSALAATGACTYFTSSGPTSFAYCTMNSLLVGQPLTATLCGSVIPGAYGSGSTKLEITTAATSVAAAL